LFISHSKEELFAFQKDLRASIKVITSCFISVSFSCGDIDGDAEVLEETLDSSFTFPPDQS
jgi:hypothetical protein